MNILRPLLALLSLWLALSFADAARAAAAPLMLFEAGAPAATHPSLYSFTDLYRLTLSGEPFGGFRLADTPAQIRVVSAAGAPEPRFGVSRPREGGRWALALAGLFACAWVAHRRLASPY